MCGRWGSQPHSVEILEEARAALPAAIAAAGPTTYVPWQDCCLATDDFLVVLHPALALLAMRSPRRHGQDGALRALARAERAGGAAVAF